jgi:hypothetical protein
MLAQTHDHDTEDSMADTNERLRLVTPSASTFDPRATDEPPARAALVLFVYLAVYLLGAGRDRA